DSSLRTHESESGWQAESELDRAVKSFAQFFNGQVVNLDQEIESETENAKKNGKGRDRSVPF
ncbi:MAG: hypothetical protein AAF728_10310, partial [Cyanobacteria bacterium P01_D01_bin.128]